MPLLSRFLPFLSMQISVSQQTYDLGRHTDDLQIERFQAILNESLFSGGKKLLSQRELGKILDVTIGTMTKYLRGEVNPFDIKSRITRNLAKHLNITCESLYSYFEHGTYASKVGVDEVEGWIRSQDLSLIGDFPRILDALSYSQAKRNSQLKGFSETIAAKYYKSVVDCFNLVGTHLKIDKKETWNLIKETSIFQNLISEEDHAVFEDIFRGKRIPSVNEIVEAKERYGNLPCFLALHELGGCEVCKPYVDIYREMMRTMN